MKRYIPWMIGLGAAIAYFAFWEWDAFVNPNSVATLSMSVYRLTTSWPPAIFIMGQFTGGLAVHFWWHWAPPGSVSEG
jgi:hypothetical protein